jgi:hypothetical protein
MRFRLTGNALEARAAREREQRGGEARGTIGRLRDLLERFALGITARRLLEQQRGEAENRAEHVVEVVRHAAREPPHALHLLCVRQPALELPGRRDVLDREDAPDDLAVLVAHRTGVAAQHARRIRQLGGLVPHLVREDAAVELGFGLRAVDEIVQLLRYEPERRARLDRLVELQHLGQPPVAYRDLGAVLAGLDHQHARRHGLERVAQVRAGRAQRRFERALLVEVLDEPFAAIHPTALVHDRHDAVHEMRQIAVIAMHSREVDFERPAGRESGAELGTHALALGGMYELFPQLRFLAEVCGLIAEQPLDRRTYFIETLLGQRHRPAHFGQRVEDRAMELFRRAQRGARTQRLRRVGEMNERAAVAQSQRFDAALDRLTFGIADRDFVEHWRALGLQALRNARGSEQAREQIDLEHRRTLQAFACRTEEARRRRVALGDVQRGIDHQHRVRRGLEQRAQTVVRRRRARATAGRRREVAGCPGHQHEGRKNEHPREVAHHGTTSNVGRER